MRDLSTALILILLSTSMAPFAAAQLDCSSGIFFSAASDSVQTITVADLSGAHVKFKYKGAVDGFGTPVQPNNFIVVIPSSATTPASVQIGLSPNVVSLLGPLNVYVLGVGFSPVDQTPANPGCGVTVTIHMPAEPAPNIQSVVNSASLRPVLSPGVMVSIFGSHLTGPTLSTTFDDTASYPTSVAATTVTFNGVAAPLLYLSPSQINAIVPFSLDGQTSLQVGVQRFGRVSATFTVPLQNTAPAIFTSSQTGTGQAVVLQQALNGPLSYNSPSNPAHAGDYLEIFATGQGVWTPPPQSDVFFFGEPFTTQPVSLTIGGQPAKTVYAGTLGATLNSWSVLQVNAVVPDGVSPGNQPVVLKIGTNDNSQQKVTVAVQ
jgi:uncharacterized protein (TIGR03437 family)